MSFSDKQCLIFDMDGLLVDTEAVYVNAWHETFQRHKVPISLETIHSWTGTSIKAVLLQLQAQLGSDIDVEQLRQERDGMFYELLAKNQVSLKPYVKEVLTKLRKTKKTLCLGTSTGRYKTEIILKHFELHQYFDYTVTSDDVNQAKPAPDIYIQCLKLTQIKASSALVFEDSLNGLLAANAAKIDVVHIPDIIVDIPPTIKILRTLDHLGQVLEGI